MKTFFSLSQRGQIIRLRNLANAALQRYNIGEASLRFLSNTDNTVFHVDQVVEENQQIKNSTASRRFILRIIRSKKNLSEEMIRAELLWLSALRTQANLVVPAYAFLFAAPSRFPSPMGCVLRWVSKGESITSGLQDAI